MKKNVEIVHKEYRNLTTRIETLAAELMMARAQRNALRALLVRQGVDPDKATPTGNEGLVGRVKSEADEFDALLGGEEEEYVEEFSGPDDPAYIEWAKKNNIAP